MLSILKSPYPCNYDQKENFKTALLIGIFVAAFLVIFEPFGISDSRDNYALIKTAGFGLVTFIVLLFMYFVVPKVFKSFFSEKNYTFGRDLIACAFMILLIALANGLYASLFLNEHVFGSIGIMIWQTFLVGIFPLSFLSLLNYNKHLSSNLKASEEIKLPELKEKAITKHMSTPKYFLISGEKETNQIGLDNLLYLESDGNYAYLNQLSGGAVTKSMHRTTLKSIEAENTYPNILRCHRSYIVNLDQVIEVKGNAQGLKLSLNNCEDIVPVSKKYIPDVKKYFA